MRITFLKIRHIRLPFKYPIIQAEKDIRSSSSIIIEVKTDQDIIAYGESCPRGNIHGESAYSVKTDMDLIRPRLLQSNFPSVDSIREFITEEINELIGESSLCALEMALLHAFAKEQEQNLAELLEAEIPDTLQYCGVIPLGRVSDFLPILEQFAFQNLKLQVNKDFNLTKANIQELRNLYGPDVKIRLDIKGRWETQNALEQIPEFLDMGIDEFEQPFPIDQDVKMGKLQRRFAGEATFIADESISRYKDAVRLIKTEGCKGFNLKLSKHGGIFQTLAIYRLARRYGVSCELGAHYGETSLLTAAGIIFSGLAPDICSREGALGRHLLEHDICHKGIKTDSHGMLNVTQKLRKSCEKVDTLRLDKYSSNLSYVA